MMCDWEIHSHLKDAANSVVEAMLDEEFETETDPFRLQKVERVRDRVVGMIALAWQLGWEMGWKEGQKELIGDGASEPDPEIIERMKHNLEKAKAEALEGK